MRFFDIVKIFSAVAAVVAVSVVAEASFDWPLAGTATMILAGCAIIGLDVWKKQPKKKVDSDFATRLLTLIYKYRDAMEDFMDSFMVSVPDLPKEEAPHLNKEQRRFQAYANFEQKRSDAVASVRQEFYDDILTSEALWGDEIRKIVEEMHIIEKFARKRVEQQLRTVNPDNSQMARKTSDKILENMKSDEELSKKFNKLVKEAERYLKQKMQ